jgi:hypothetical protein
LGGKAFARQADLIESGVEHYSLFGFSYRTGVGQNITDIRGIKPNNDVFHLVISVFDLDVE